MQSAELLWALEVQRIAYTFKDSKVVTSIYDSFYKTVYFILKCNEILIFEDLMERDKNSINDSEQYEEGPVTRFVGPSFQVQVWHEGAPRQGPSLFRNRGPGSPQNHVNEVALQDSDKAATERYP